MKVVIIAGGKGTRLGLKEIPKPMVSIADKPILEHQIDLAGRYGLKDIFILSGHLAENIFDHFGNGEQFGVNITHIVEPYPLGTAGSVKLLEHLIDEKFFIFYGDVIMDVDLKKMIEFDACNESIATIAVHPNDHPYDSDLVKAGKDNDVAQFLPKPHEDGIYYQNLVNAALYICSPKIFDFIPFGKSTDFGKHIFSEVLKQNQKITAYKTPEYIKDMGTLDRLDKVTKDITSGKVSRLNLNNKRKAIFLDRDGVINKYVDNLSRIEDFELNDGVVEAITKINKSEYLSIVVTNQPMIAKGFLTREKLQEIHNKMETVLGEKRAYVDDINYCPHHPEKGFEGEIEELKINCTCRKPEPGMLNKAASIYNIDMSGSWMIGDHERDILAGKNAGCKTILINAQELNKCDADYVSKNLFEAIDHIFTRDES